MPAGGEDRVSKKKRVRQQDKQRLCPTHAQSPATAIPAMPRYLFPSCNAAFSSGRFQRYAPPGAIFKADSIMLNRLYKRHLWSSLSLPPCPQRASLCSSMPSTIFRHASAPNFLCAKPIFSSVLSPPISEASKDSIHPLPI